MMPLNMVTVPIQIIRLLPLSRDCELMALQPVRHTAAVMKTVMQGPSCNDHHAAWAEGSWAHLNLLLHVEYM